MSQGYGLDMASSGLVRCFEGGDRGTTHPGMPWDPESSRAVAAYLAAR